MLESSATEMRESADDSGGMDAEADDEDSEGVICSWTLDGRPLAVDARVFCTE